MHRLWFRYGQASECFMVKISFPALQDGGAKDIALHRKLLYWLSGLFPGILRAESWDLVKLLRDLFPS